MSRSIVDFLLQDKFWPQHYLDLAEDFAEGLNLALELGHQAMVKFLVKKVPNEKIFEDQSTIDKLMNIIMLSENCEILKIFLSKLSDELDNVQAYGNALLCLAVENDRLDILKEIIDFYHSEGEVLELSIKENNHLLSAAIERKNIDVLSWLLENDCIQDADMWTLSCDFDDFLMWGISAIAAQKSTGDAFAHLLMNQDSFKDGDLLNKDQMIPVLLKLTALFGNVNDLEDLLAVVADHPLLKSEGRALLDLALGRGNIETVDRLLQEEAIRNKLTGSDARSFLCDVLDKGDLYSFIVDELLTINNVQNALAGSKNAILRKVIIDGDMERVDQLLAMGSVQQALREDECAKLVICAVAESGNHSLFGKLSNAKVLKQNPVAVLCSAAKGGSVAIINQLLKHQVVKEKVGCEQNRVLLAAVEKNHFTVVERLLKLDTVKQSKNNYQIFMIAVKKGFQGIACQLLETEQVKTKAAKSGNAALKYAMKNGCEDLERKLLLLPVVQNELSTSGVTLFRYAVRYNRFEACHRIAEVLWPKGLSQMPAKLHQFIPQLKRGASMASGNKESICFMSSAMRRHALVSVSSLYQSQHNIAKHRHKLVCKDHETESQKIRLNAIGERAHVNIANFIGLQGSSMMRDVYEEMSNQVGR